MGSDSMDLDKDLAARQEARLLCRQGEKAQKILCEMEQAQLDAIVEAVALNFADNTDAKIQSFTELMESTNEPGWTGFNRLFDSKVIETRME